ncbi:MAG: single-stranded DNA-binding protein [Oscillospiraceae bacterium]|nr:single-stranded DNA-binding protein [Oscillospiraceae bacterium]
MYNKVIMMGRIVNDPELKTTPQGVNVCSFRIAVDRRFTPKGEERKSDFFNVVAWRQQAEFVNRYFSKGRMILVEGEMTTRNYTDKNGNPATWYEIVADRISFTGEKSQGGSYNDYAASAPSAPAPQAPTAPQQAPAPDFSSAPTDDYPF